MRQPQRFLSIFLNPFRSVLIDSRLNTLENNMAVTKAELNAKLDTIINQVVQEASEVKAVISALETKIASPVTEDYTEELEKLNQISTALEAIAPSLTDEIVTPLEDTELLSTQEVADLTTSAGSEPSPPANSVSTNDDSTTPPSTVNPEQSGDLVLGVDLGAAEPGAVTAMEGALPSQTSVLVDDSAISEESQPPEVPVKLESAPSSLTQPLSAPTDAGVTVGEEPRIRSSSDASTPISRAQTEPETVQSVDKSGQVKNVQESEGSTPDGIPLI